MWIWLDSLRSTPTPSHQPPPPFWLGPTPNSFNSDSIKTPSKTEIQRQKWIKCKLKKQVTCVINTPLSWQVSHTSVLIFFENIFTAKSNRTEHKVNICTQEFPSQGGKAEGRRQSIRMLGGKSAEKGGRLSCIRVTVVNLPVETGTFSIIEF